MITSEIVKNLLNNRTLDDESFLRLLSSNDFDLELLGTADEVRKSIYGRDVYLRGLIEFTNICANDCFYCGLRKSNKKAERYRMSEDEILACWSEAYISGFRTVVLQGGEDPYFTDDVLCSLVSEIKSSSPGCAVTLSIGERSFESYKALRKAGADRYLLRHETADSNHYGFLHPEEMNIKKRMECLFQLKSLGYQTGTGFMVGSPKQTLENILSDIRLIEELKPEMIGIGPFIPHPDTPFSKYEKGSADMTIKLIAIFRLMLPNALIPATTALNTVCETGRLRALKSGANVIMPNLSPLYARKKYSLYENKKYSTKNAYGLIKQMEQLCEKAGYVINMGIGNYKAD